MLVSIVMPSFNQAGFIEQSIDSVLNQSYQNIELIIADGGSTDNSLEILRHKQSNDSRIRWSSATDSGPAYAINKALKQARGTIIGWLNSDDLYTEGAIQRAVDILACNEQWLMVYGHGEHIDDVGKVLDQYPTLTANVSIRCFLDGCFICQPTVFFKYAAYVLQGGLDEALQAAFDFDYWLRAFAKFPERITFIDKVQAQSRLHSDCITQKMRHTVAIEGMRVSDRHLNEVPAHWLLTYIDEILDSDLNILNAEAQQALIKTALESGIVYLSAKELKYLHYALAQNEQLIKLT